MVTKLPYTSYMPKFTFVPEFWLRTYLLSTSQMFETTDKPVIFYPDKALIENDACVVVVGLSTKQIQDCTSWRPSDVRRRQRS